MYWGFVCDLTAPYYEMLGKKGENDDSVRSPVLEAGSVLHTYGVCGAYGIAVHCHYDMIMLKKQTFP